MSTNALPGVAQWSDLTAPELSRWVAADAVAVLPLGAIEQHGPHLPLSTDVDIGQGLLNVALRSSVAPPLRQYPCRCRCLFCLARPSEPARSTQAMRALSIGAPRRCLRPSMPLALRWRVRDYGVWCCTTATAVTRR